MDTDIKNIFDKVNTLDLSKVRARVTRENNWNDEHATRVEKQYKMFFTLSGLEDGVLAPPTNDIDIFWHAHILHTKAYDLACNSVHGKFIHHSPAVDLSSEGKIINSERTKKLFCEIFGSSPEGKDLVSCCCQGGGCATAEGAKNYD